ERLVDDVPPAEKRRRLNALLQRQEGIGLERNERWLGLTTQVLADAVTPPRVHDHADDVAAGATGAAQPRPGEAMLAGRNREHRLVHLAGPASMVGQLVDVRIEHAGPYSLRGSLA